MSASPFLTSIQPIWKKIGGKKRMKRRAKFDQASSSWTKDGWKRAMADDKGRESIQKKRFFNQMRFQPWFLLYVWRVLAKLKIVRSLGNTMALCSKKDGKKLIKVILFSIQFLSRLQRGFVAFIVLSWWMNCRRNNKVVFSSKRWTD